jgi:methanogenic corrinoid protein MtbC1
VEAVTRFDEDALDRELRRLLLGGAALDDVDESVVPAMRRVGELWHDGELSIAHEHLATNHIGTFLRNVLRLGRRTGTHKALLACFAEEQHEIGLLVVGTWLSAWGVQPVFLGRRVPPSAVADAVRALRPRLVTLSVTISPETSVASALLEEYAEACGDVPWLVGGAGAGPLLKRLPERAGHLAPGVRSEFKAVAARLLETSGGLPREWMSE